MHLKTVFAYYIDRMYKNTVILFYYLCYYIDFIVIVYNVTVIQIFEC